MPRKATQDRRVVVENSDKTWYTGEGNDRGWDYWMASRTQWTLVWVTPRVGVGQEAWLAAIHGVAKSPKQLSDWTELNWTEFTLIHGPNIPGFYAILFFTTSEFTFITSHIHKWVLFSLWLRFFTLSGVISPLFSSSILGTYLPGELIFPCPI